MKNYHHDRIAIELKNIEYFCTSFQNLKEAVRDQKIVLKYIPGQKRLYYIIALQEILQGVRFAV